MISNLFFVKSKKSILIGFVNMMHYAQIVGFFGNFQLV